MQVLVQLVPAGVKAQVPVGQLQLPSSISFSDDEVHVYEPYAMLEELVRLGLEEPLQEQVEAGLRFALKGENETQQLVRWRMCAPSQPIPAARIGHPCYALI